MVDFYRFCLLMQILRIFCIFVKLPESLFEPMFSLTVKKSDVQISNSSFEAEKI